jgi:serine protease SohB
MDFVFEYGLFLAKVITMVLAIVIVAIVVVALAARDKDPLHRLKIKRYNKRLDAYAETLHEKVLNKKSLKAYKKRRKLELKKLEADEEAPTRKRYFVINFDGDIRASAAQELREMVTALLTTANSNDEVVACIESSGGMVHSYGFAASQLQRIRDAGIPLTACIDKVAASGGYLMACVANRVISAPFAIIGSIGVIAQAPNFHRLLKKHDIDFEQITAGEYKRTLSLFGENTKQGREKCREDVENTHHLFKTFVSRHRPMVQIEKVATGEIWYGIDAKDLSLVDTLSTSDDYLSSAAKDYNVFEVCYQRKKQLSEKIGDAMRGSIDYALAKFGVVSTHY